MLPVLMRRFKHAWPSVPAFVPIATFAIAMFPKNARASDFSGMAALVFSPFLLIAAAVAAISRRTAAVVLVLLAVPLLLALSDATAGMSRGRGDDLVFFWGSLAIYAITTGWRLIPFPTDRARMYFVAGSSAAFLAGLAHNAGRIRVNQGQEAVVAVVNARVHWKATSQETVEAIAAGSNGSISAKGTRKDVEPYFVKGTRIIDAGGRAVLPGLRDILLDDRGLIDEQALRELAKREAEQGVTTLIHVAPHYSLLPGRYEFFSQQGVPRQPPAVTLPATHDVGSDLNLDDLRYRLRETREPPMVFFPYADDPRWSAHLGDDVRAIEKGGFRVLIEAPNPGAVRGALAALSEQGGSPLARLRGALLGVRALCAGDAALFATRRLGLVAVPWLHAEEASDNAVCGNEPIVRFPFREVTRLKSHVALATAGSGADSPWMILRAVVTGEAVDDRHRIDPGQRIGIEEALAMWTTEPARIFEGGDLTVGNLDTDHDASFLVLGKDPFAVPMPKVEPEVLLTVAGGEITEQSPVFGAW